MIRMRKPDQFCSRHAASSGPRAAGGEPGGVIPAYHTHPSSVHALIAEISGPGTGGPTKAQGSWDYPVEDDSSGTWTRIGLVRKYPDHRVEYVPDPVPAPSPAA